MELKEAYIDGIICHHFSMDPSRNLINNSQIGMEDLDSATLKDFFIKPFSNVKTEFSFSHPVDLSYNVVYQTVLKIIEDADFVKCSQDIFRHLQSVSTSPAIKDGDLFIARISDVLIDDSFCDGLGIFKIERKNDFIETYLDKDGNMRFAVKNGFSANRIDKACLIVLTKSMPKCMIIDTSRDTRFWRQDFLGLIPMPNAYSKSKAVIDVFQSFVTDELSRCTNLTKNEQVNMLNKWTENAKSSDKIDISRMADDVLLDDETKNQFWAYCKAYEEREGIRLSGTFEADRKAISIPKKIRTIKLDDTAEINLMKTGSFIERGFDEGRGLNYYKLYFSKEK